MADTFAQFETLLIESVDDMVYDRELRDDDISWRILDTMAPIPRGGRATDGAGQSDANTPEFEASWRMRVQRAGLITAGQFGEGNLTMMGADDHLAMGQDVGQLYPDPTKAALRSWITVKTLLKVVKGVLPINEDQIDTDLIGNPIEEVAMEHVEDVLGLLRKYICTNFWSDGSGLVAQVNNSAGYSVTTSPTEVAIDVGTPFRFEKGQRYIFGSNVAQANYGSSARTYRTGATSGTTGIARCVEINEKDRTVYFEAEPASGTITLTDNDAIVQHDTVVTTGTTVTAQSLCPNGVESLLVDSGDFPDTSHTVTDYEALRAQIAGDESAKVPPNAENMAVLLDQMMAAGITPPPLWISEQSVQTLYAQAERQGGAVYPVNQGAPYQASGGISGAVFQHYNYTPAWLLSSLCRPGAIHGLDPADWMKWMPIGKAVRWKFKSGSMAGASSIFQPVMSGTQVTGLAQAPFKTFVQFGVKTPRAQFRRIGFQNARDVVGT